MSNFDLLSLDVLLQLDLSNRPFLHEQGQYICRGYVVSLNLDDDRWTLNVRDIDYLRKSDGSWQPDCGKDSYSGNIGPNSFRGVAEGLLTIMDHGLEIHIGPASDQPWSDIDWPELDALPGGFMDAGAFSKREKKKRRKKRL